MLRGIIAALLLLWNGSAFCQINYVLNPDFELHTGCPQANENIRLANFWSAIDSNATQLSCVADYCHTCASSTSYLNGVPSSSTYWQYPHSGNAFVQMIFFYDEENPSYANKRDYLQGRLVRKLTAGKTYCVSFYVCLAEASFYAVKDIGAYLDNGSIDTASTCGGPQTRYTPQVVCNTIITDTMNWTKVEGSFVATGKEQFITIGNFKDKAHTTLVTVPFNRYTIGRNFGAYLIDDVSVVESSLKANAGPDRHVGLGDSVYIGLPKEVGLENTWTKLGSPTIIGTGTGIWVKPTVATSYVVNQTLCGNITRDTVKVDVWKLGVNSINGKTQHYSLSPNPADGIIQITQSENDYHPVTVTVHNTLGIVVYKGEAVFNNSTSQLDLSSLASGMYYMVLHDSSGSAYTLRFVKK